MLFTQIEFIVFFAALLSCLAFIRSNTLRKVVLLAASYYFYAYWDYRFLSLILVSTLSDYHIGKLLYRETMPGRRKLWVGLSIAINIGILGFFKYFNFFTASLEYFLRPLGINVGSLNLILPVGISFYTFKTLSYTLDLYRRQIDRCTSLLDYALFVGFFPPLLAGPIVRASQFLPQLKSSSSITLENLLIGFRFFVVGLFMKLFIADNIAIYIDHVLANAAAFDSTTIWLAMISYTLQIYCDFAGYTNMAIGTAKIVGYDLPENFNWPYLSHSITEFWRRWHITLSGWIRDYIYYGLGGSRSGTGRTYANLMLAMTLCGLWHGAAWTFVFWGLFHGAALTLNRIWLNVHKPPLGQTIGRITLDFLSWFTTLLTVVVGWVFFRAQDFRHAGLLLKKMFYPQAGVIWYPPFVLFVLISCALVHFAESAQWRHLLRWPLTAWYTPAALFSMIWLCIIFPPEEFRPFVYFQF